MQHKSLSKFLPCTVLWVRSTRGLILCPILNSSPEYSFCNIFCQTWKHGIFRHVCRKCAHVKRQYPTSCSSCFLLLTSPLSNGQVHRVRLVNHLDELCILKWNLAWRSFVQDTCKREKTRGEADVEHTWSVVTTDSGLETQHLLASLASVLCIYKSVAVDFHSVFSWPICLLCELLWTKISV